MTSAGLVPACSATSAIRDSGKPRSAMTSSAARSMSSRRWSAAATGVFCDSVSCGMVTFPGPPVDEIGRPQRYRPAQFALSPTVAAD